MSEFETMTVTMTDLSDDALELLADICLPNYNNPALQATAYNRVLEQQDRLIDFWTENNFQPVPLPESLILIWKDGGKKNVPSAAISAMHKLGAFGFGVEFISAVEKTKDGKTWLNGTSKELTMKSVGLGMQPEKLACTAYNASLHSELPAVYVDSFGDFLVHFINSQGLAPEKMMELVAILRPSFEISGTEATLAKDNGNGIYVNLADRSVVTRGNSRVAMQSVSVNATQIESTVVLMTVLLQVGSNSFVAKKIPGKLNTLPGLFERDPRYGEPLTDDEPTGVIMNNDCMPMQAVVSDEYGSLNCWPWLVVIKGDFDLSIAAKFAANGKAYVFDKYAMKSIGSELAANAMLIGRRQIGEIDEMITLHDASKESKFYNRGPQGRKHLKAKLDNRTFSSFKVQLPNGKKIAQSGVRYFVSATNSRLTAGSGPVFVNNLDLASIASVPKTKKFKVPYDRLPKAIRLKLEAEGGKEGDRKLGMEALKGRILNTIETYITQERVFSPGEDVVSFGGGSLVFLTNKDANQAFRITGVAKEAELSPKNDGYMADSFDITLDIELILASDWKKLRNDGIKLTTLPYPIEWFDHDGHAINPGYNIVLNNETQKGKLVHIPIFCNSNGGGTTYPNEGILVMENGNKIDLLAVGPHCFLDNKLEVDSITDWVRANTKVRYMQLKMARAEWDVFSRFSNHEDVELVDNSHADYVVVKECVQVLEGYHHFEVEISTPEENTGDIKITPEMLAVFTTCNRKLGELLFAESSDYRNVISQLVAMIVNKPVGFQVVDLSTLEGRNQVKNGVGSLDGLSDSQIVDKFSKLFKTGVVFQSKSTHTGAVSKLNLNFNVLRSMSTFIGGAASGISEEVVAFLNFISNPDDKGYDGKINSRISHLRSSLQGWLEKSMESRGILKKAAKTLGFVGAKIRTTYDPTLNHQQGELPKIKLHAQCDALKKLAKKVSGKYYPAYLDKDGKFDPFLMNGEIIIDGRVPMPFPTCNELIVADDDTIAVGHASKLPHIWAKGADSDSDGDGIFMLNGGARGLTYAEALAINESPLSQQGYEVCYGSNPANWPCAEFSSLSDKLGKKALVPDNAKYLTPYATLIPEAKYRSGAELVSRHYKICVGTAYAICSVLSFQTCDRSYGNTSKEIMDLYLNATAIAWRLLYEGVGLSGYSVKAKRFFDVLEISLWAKEFAVVDGVIVRAKDKTPAAERFNCLAEMVKILEIGHLDNAKALVLLIKRARKISADRKAIEKGRSRVQYMSSDEKATAAVWTGLRAIGQAMNEGGFAELEAYQDQISGEDTIPESLFTIIEKQQLWNDLKCPWLAELLQEGTMIQNTVTKKLFDLKQAEEQG